MKWVLFFFFCCALGVIVAQDGQYAAPDSVAEEVSKTKYKEVRDLTYALTDDFEEDEMKYRAIVKWVSLNIEYKIIDSEDGNDVIKRGKAKCAGYSLLVHEMCFHAGLQSRIVVGDCRDELADIGQRLDFEEHAWNAVKINGEWLLSDATWATGWYDEENRETVYEFRDEYFLSKPEDFVKLGHYAHEEELMFLEETYPKNKYRKEPKYKGDYVREGKSLLYQDYQNGKVGRVYRVEVVKSDTLDYSAFKISYKEGEDWFVSRPMKMIDKGDRLVLKFDLREVKSNSLTFGYGGRYYFSMIKK